MFKLLPKMYDWIMQSRITRVYDEMRSIEREMESGRQGYNAETMNAKLEDLSIRANRLLLSLPTSYASSLYTLRGHINFVRGRLASSPGRNQR